MRFEELVEQVASAMGIPPDHVDDEMNSLLSGMVQARKHRIATALGITNSDIRLAKDRGVLFTFVSARLAGFLKGLEHAG